MFIRTSRSGGHTYLRLVESYRDDDGKVRHRQIAQLGRVDQFGEDQAERLIRSIRQVTGRQLPEPGTPEFEVARELGGPWVLTELWRSLGMDNVLKRIFRSSRRTVDIESLLRIMVFNRLCDPDSKLGVIRWLETIVMPGVDTDSINHQQLLRAMDALDEEFEQFRQGMGRLLRPLIDQELSVVFYDLTTIRIHGEGDIKDDIRKYGLSKELKGPARQCMLGIIQTADGLPLDFEVFPGNTAEVKTLLPMLKRSLDNHPVKRVVLVADRGLLSLDNVAELESLCLESGHSPEYILAVPAGRYKEFQSTIAHLSFDESKESIRETQMNGRRLVVAHSPSMAATQKQRRDDQLNELIQLGDQLADKLDRQDAGKTERGRRASDRGAFVRFSRAVQEAHFTRFIRAELQADGFAFEVNQAAIRKAETLDGKLILLTNVPDMSADEIVSRYKALADIERGFRVLKSEIEIAPVYHRLPKRIRAHAGICFMALLLHRVMRMRLKDSTLGITPERALSRLKQVQYHSVMLNEQRLTGITKLESEQLRLFEALGIEKPTAQHL